MRDYSLTTVVTDTFKAPRWVHHAVKFGTGFAVWWVITAIMIQLARADTARSVAAGALLSLGWFLSIRVRDALDHQTAFFKPDLWCDLALHLAPIAVVLCAVGAPDIGLLPLIGCVLLYARTYPDASP